ncbi:MAG TPA: zinc ABC transporter substrate-binding protein [Clostridiaceae bacterium]|jgi:zinc transport system substrate-binding protein|nr:zinc ABC transporter substrate-binding protein [Clostridiaceae bacterium]
MKKTGLLILTFMLFLVFSACSGPDGNIGFEQDKDTLIVTSFYPMYIFTSNIADGIEGVRVVNMTEPQTGCLHDYQLVPADMKILEKADIFIINGAGMESFLEKVISQLPELTIIEAAKGMELLDDENGEKNPHVWVSISGAIQEVRNITDGLIAADPANETFYRKNSENYIKKLEALKQSMHDALKDIETRDIVTFHEAFPYFAHEFDLNIVSVIEREPGSEPSAGELAETIKAINEAQVKVLFTEPQYSPKAAESIAAQTGAKIYILDPVVTGPKDAESDSYERIMKENLEVLIEALK